ncbi:hypothetical protein D9M68_704900 [compost metagenome]
MAVRNFGDGRDVGHVARRVAQRLDEHRLGALVEQLLETARVAVVREARGDAELRQRVGEQVVGATVQRRAADDVVTGFGDGLDRVGHGRLARGQRQRGNAAFERGHALLQHVLRRVVDAGVDVARHFQVEQVRAVLRAVEGVGHGLVDRRRNRAGGRVGRVAGVDRQGFEFPVLRHATAFQRGMDETTQIAQRRAWA